MLPPPPPYSPPPCLLVSYSFLLLMYFSKNSWLRQSDLICGIAVANAVLLSSGSLCGSNSLIWSHHRPLIPRSQWLNLHAPFSKLAKPTSATAATAAATSFQPPQPPPRTAALCCIHMEMPSIGKYTQTRLYCQQAVSHRPRVWLFCQHEGTGGSRRYPRAAMSHCVLFNMQPTGRL